MEIRKYIKYTFSLILATFILPVFCYGYANETTHPALTKETIELFNHYYYPDLNISNKEKSFIEKGSKEEDLPEIRCLNHFYDPIYERGLTEGTPLGLKAKNWSQNTRAQAGLNLASVGTIRDYFSAGSDYSWDRAVYEYVWGDKQRGLEALGHVLHLVQDMSVPPHVRNDQHATDPSPYETFTKDFNTDNIYDISGILISENKKPVVAGNLNNYFYRLAKFTNENFFSESTLPDSLFNKYTNPKINFEKNGFGYGDDSSYRLVNVDYVTNKLMEIVGVEYSVYDKKHQVLTDYWSILSKQAVLHGAGVIKLFFEDVEKEKQTQALYNMNKSFAQKVGDKIVSTGKEITSAGENIATTFYNTVNSAFKGNGSDNLAFSGIGVTDSSSDLDNQDGSPQNQKEEPADANVEKPVDNTLNNELITTGQEIENIYPVEEPVDNNLSNQENNQQNQQNQQNEDNTTEDPNEDSQNNILSNNTPISTGYSAGFGGGGGTSEPEEPIQQNSQDPTTNEEEKTQLEKINPPTITSPLNNQYFTENSILFIGKATSTNIIYSDFDNLTTSADQNEDWQILLEDLEQGSSTISFFASNKDQTATSTKTIINLFVDSIAPEVSLTVKECQNSLSQTGCLLATTTPTINVEWSSDEEDFSHFILNQNGTTSTTTATTTQITILNNQIYTISVSAIDKMGNISDEAKQIIEINNSPVIINEVAWAGTSKTTSSDEWIELYNNTNHEINLENWTLYSEDETPYINLSGSIPANGYYLLERTDDTTVSDITADLIYTGALSNNGEHLFLSFFENNATTTVDEILKANNWNQKGSHVAYTTMERLDRLHSGTDWNAWGGSMNKDILNGKTAEGDDIKGTPKARNSITYLISNQGALYEDKTLTKENSPYFIKDPNFEIKEGVTLTVEEGVVIKFESSHRVRLVVKGNLKTKGTAENPVVFTSFYDDEYGGDTNNDGPCEPNNASSTSACPSAGNWKQIFIESTSKDSSFDHTITRYGGAFADGEYMKFKGMVAVENTEISVENSIFEKSMSRGLYLMNVGSSTVISNNIFRDNNWDRNIGTRYPYGLDSSGNGYTVKNNLFENNVYGASFSASSAIVESNIFNNNIDKAVDASGANLFSDNFGSGNGVNGIMLRSDITVASSTNILKKNQLPYVIGEATVTVVASSTLKIDPGVVIKFTDRHFIVEGNLDVNGSESEKVLFTSISDDSDGSDVQNNSQSEEIGIGSRLGLYFKPGSTSTIKNAEIKYLKYGTHYEGSPINLQNVTFKNNDTAIYADANSIVQTAENIIFENNQATSTIPLF